MAEQNVKQKVLDKDTFDYLKEKNPDFLQSYSFLSQFYIHLTEYYSRKIWKDGRIVLTPKKEFYDMLNKIKQNSHDEQK